MNEVQQSGRWQAYELSSFQATPLQKQLALVTALLILIASLIVMPVAREMWPEVSAFLPAFLTGAALMELITSYLLFCQFYQTRIPVLCFWGATYLYSALVIVPHLLTFPGVFSPTGLLGAKEQTEIWFWVFWHGGYPLGVLASLLLAKRYPKKLSREQAKAWLWTMVGMVVGTVVALTVLTTHWHDLLPTLMEQGQSFKLLSSGIGVAVWLLDAAALWLLVRMTRLRFTLHLWLTLAILASLLDVTVTLFSGARYSVGWYVARMNSLLSAGILLIVLMIEFNRLYRNLIESEQRYASLFRLNPDAVYSFDVTGKFESINPACEKLSGHTVEEMGKVHFKNFMYEADRELCQLHFQKALQGQSQQFETRVVHKRGHLVDVLVTIMPISVDDEIVGVYGIAKDITDRKRAEATINQMVYHDALTGLPNRRLFKDRLTLALNQARHHEHKLAVMFLDLDRFKVINDTLGHTIGDQLLKATAERLKACVREFDTVARMGGDEFTILLPEIAQEEVAHGIARRIMQEIKRPMLIEGQELHVTTSIGIALYPNDGDDADTLMKHADKAMYRAKESGKNTFRMYDERMNDRSHDLLLLENDLRKALEREEFLVYYQPQLDLRTGAIVGMEALVRWRHPERGLVSPGEFIPLAEETGLIVPLGEWVLRTACRQAKEWQDRGFPPLRVAVNLSAKQFQQDDLVKMVANVLVETGMKPELLELEITESVAMVQVNRAIVTLQELTALGIEIAIDDFGTGYSSLTYLKNFPIHRLKIDQSFVRDLTTDSGDAEIVATIIAMAKSLGLDVIAEGVETAEQLQFLRAHGCHEMQGSLFSDPVTPERFETVVRVGQAMFDVAQEL
jgi:diguanylate cyclase (GGDEF)-like protein/PAS domain S-box-containing protein